MTLRQRYGKLTFWNKAAFWGSVASMLGLLIAVLSWLFSPGASLHQQTHGDQSPAISGVQGNVTIIQQKESKP
jgi:hypothetical protein